MDEKTINFETDVLQRSRELPVLVDFWAPWCGPCKVLTPVLERLATEATGRWTLAQINTDEQPELARRHGIRSIPTVKLFRDGTVVDEFVGALPEDEIRRWLKASLPSPYEGILTRARTLLDREARAEAAGLLESILSEDPDNDQARVLLAEALLVLDPARIDNVLQPVGFASDFSDKAEGLRALTRLIVLADRPDELPEHAVKSKYLAGLQRLKAGDFAGALEAFIEVVQRKRDYADEAPKHACKAIFQALGLHHPVAERYYNAFTSALYS
ncbi:MAG: thioredoxin [Acidobacteria bacterium]|nr:thioredoxin [Acidobacteriota bacterium]